MDIDVLVLWVVVLCVGFGWLCMYFVVGNKVNGRCEIFDGDDVVVFGWGECGFGSIIY